MHSSSKNPSKIFNVALSTCRKVLLLNYLFARYLESDKHLKDKNGGVFEYRREGTIMLFRIQEACQYLAVSRSTIYRLINAGKITPIYIGGAPRISQTNIKSLVGDIDD